MINDLVVCGWVVCPFATKMLCWFSFIKQHTTDNPNRSTSKYKLYFPTVNTWLEKVISPRAV